MKEAPGLNYVAVLVLRRKQDTFCKNNSNLEMIGP